MKKVRIAAALISISVLGFLIFPKLIWAGPILALYFLPGLVAYGRGHHNALAITVLTVIVISLSAAVEVMVVVDAGLPLATLAHPELLPSDSQELLGVTILVCGAFWLAALVWACTAVRRTQVDTRALGVGAVEAALQK
jgi:hypothetical protein